ncbi:MAG: cell envelope biogenesis protein OmpA [Bacteroidetes bacterium]|nr:MAG: cell envelope biogenesis protein OmpA [Bacteroidota bacterium]
MQVMNKNPFTKFWLKGRFLSILIFIFTTLNFSCVTSKQFKDVQSQKDRLQSERDSLLGINERLTVENTEISSQINNLKDELEELKRDKSAMTQELDNLKKDYQIMKRGYYELQQAQTSLVKGNNRETRRLLKQLQTTQEELQAREDKLREMSRVMDEKKRALDELQYEVDKRNARLLELEKLLTEKDEMMNELKRKVSKALMGFENDGLTITQKNGKIYVSMDEKLLFKSGSYKVDSRGEQAISKIARVLEQNTDINIMIEVHTDNVPYRSSSGQIEDNWDLSVKRATTIVKLLLKRSTINPKRVTAAGRGEFFPVDPANTPEARQKNRRTEIILTPNLDELYKLLDTSN